MRSSDLLRSVLWPAAVVLESDEVELLLALSWSKVEDVLSAPFILLLSDLLSEVVVLEELGVELELVSWLCARAPEAASARARTDNATNLIGNTSAVVVYPEGWRRPTSFTTHDPSRGGAWTGRASPERPEARRAGPNGSALRKNSRIETTPRTRIHTRRCASRSGS